MSLTEWGPTRKSDTMGMLSRRCDYVLGKFIACTISTLRIFGSGDYDVVLVVSPFGTFV